MKTKNEIYTELKNLVDKYKGKPWNDSLREEIQETVMTYFKNLGISARDIKISCDDEGYVSLHADDFYKLKDAN